MNHKLQWLRVNHDLVAKAIGELDYEEVLQVSPSEDTAVFDDPTSLQFFKDIEVDFQLKTELKVFTIEFEKRKYFISGWKTLWGFLRVHQVICLQKDENELVLPQAHLFYCDCQAALGMDDLLLSQFLEEMNNTLFSDQQVLSKQRSLSIEKLAQCSFLEMQSHFNGHPKAVLNKGRLGFSATQIQDYGPEMQHPTQFHFLLAHKSILKSSYKEGSCNLDLVAEMMSPVEFDEIEQILVDKGLNSEEYEILPVHEYQFDRFIRLYYQNELASELLLDLGQMGYRYRPQISLRSFSNTDFKEACEIKLPISILNTSCVRGLPDKTLGESIEIAASLRSIISEDEFLNKKSVIVLEELGGIHIRPETFKTIEKAPYRINELLGAIWRKGPEAYLVDQQQVVLTSSLHHQQQGKSLIGQFIENSGLTTDDWLKAYFEVVILPLYHFQVKYGLGLVSHGQNIMLQMENFKPIGVFLKDFQGDLRISEDPKYDKWGLTQFKSLVKLPNHYLIHDLLTGHFVTVLRFISSCLEDHEGFSETHFYSLLSNVIKDYLDTEDITLSAGQNLLDHKIAKVLINRVRFKLGYHDSNERPIPILGKEIPNPLLTDTTRIGTTSKNHERSLDL